MLRLLMHATDCCQVWGILKHATNGCQAWNNFTPFTFVPAKFTDVRCLMKNRHQHPWRSCQPARHGRRDLGPSRLGLKMTDGETYFVSDF